MTSLNHSSTFKVHPFHEGIQDDQSLLTDLNNEISAGNTKDYDPKDDLFFTTVPGTEQKKHLKAKVAELANEVGGMKLDLNLNG